MRIIAVRHAETQWNLDRIIQGHLDSPVTEKGFRQIASLLKEIKNFPITRVISSPAGRACTTAQILATHFGCQLETDENLHEQNFGLLEGLSFEQAQNCYPAITSRLFTGEPTIAAPEGESAIQVVQRIMAYLQRLAVNNHDKTLCLVTHGLTLQALIWILKGGKLQEETRQYAHQNCSYSVIDITEEYIEVVNWGIATHLFLR
ncbi:histidine phosphatase family protein [Xenorhabdus sp. XENO-7]|uniref:Histidine phosphatase family protein n=1 Tax=Xenorhabdus aichiensis TaxID=3025874 RepID=A0ABT5M328_9GAMM|nr:histidine phosphatase family protein [Xenorhabdus aichiensis]MDC9622087.1 histidine phosphatase family protein [Xenorhabdus aichiensis]